MGILDDAIRQHLELKRRQGADDEELAKLEDEAFGPPARPGDPDFPEQDEGANGQVAEPGVPVAEEPGEGPRDESATAVEEPPAAERVEGEPPAAAGALFDADQDDLDLDLDLELEDDEGVELEAAMAEPAVEAEAAPPATDEQEIAGDIEEPPAESAPIESLDTVEHHFEGALDEAEVVEEGEGSPPPAPASEDEGTDGEDVLEETPEFLRDAPEDDELWFEQGEPKDFDF